MLREDPRRAADTLKDSPPGLAKTSPRHPLNVAGSYRFFIFPTRKGPAQLPFFLPVEGMNWFGLARAVSILS